MEILILIAVVVLILASALRRDAQEFGPGCAVGLLVIFLVVLFVTVAGSLAAKGMLP